MNKIGIPMAKDPLPELLRFYDRQGREYHDWQTRADQYIYYVSYVAKTCKYEVIRGVESEDTSKESRRLLLDTIETFRNGQWVSVTCEPMQQDDEPDEVDDDEYMKVIGYA